MSDRQLPASSSYIPFSPRTIFPRHRYLIQAEENKLISDRLGCWFYEHAVIDRTPNSPNARAEIGWTVDGTALRFTSIERILKNPYAPLLEICAPNDNWAGYYAHLLRRSTLNDLYREVLTKHGLSHTLPVKIPHITPLPGFDFVDEPK